MCLYIFTRTLTIYEMDRLGIKRPTWAFSVKQLVIIRHKLVTFMTLTSAILTLYVIRLILTRVA